MKRLAAAAGVALVGAIAVGAWWLVTPSTSPVAASAGVERPRENDGLPRRAAAPGLTADPRRDATDGIGAAVLGIAERLPDVEACLTGRVLELSLDVRPPDGPPVSDVLVALGLEGHPPQQTRTDAAGAFEFRFASGVLVEFVAIGSSERTQATRRSVGRAFSAGEFLDLTLEVIPSSWGRVPRGPPLRHLALQVVDSSGSPVAGLELELQDEHGNAVGPLMGDRRRVTDEGGIVRVRGLPAERLVLLATRRQLPARRRGPRTTHRFELDLRSQVTGLQRIVIPVETAPAERAVVLWFRRASDGPRGLLVGIGRQGEEAARASAGRVDLDRILPPGRTLGLQLERLSRSETVRVDRRADGTWRLDDGSARGFFEPIVWQVAPEAGVLRVELPGHAAQRAEIPAGLDDVHVVCFFAER